MDWWEKLLQWITDHKDALGWLFGTGVATALLTGLYKLVRWLIEARRRRQLRPRHGPFVVLPPGSDLLPVLLPDPTDSPLSDYRIPYLERQPGRSVRREIEDLLREKGALLVLGKSGIGKTREAAHLAQMLNSEGWTVLYLPPDAYLEPPASLPSGCPARKILLFLDDLNRRCYAARREVSPRAEESLAMPLTEPFQRRLQKTLEVFEAFCGKGELLILATARNEQTPEYEGEPAEWDKLEWDRYPDLWKRFALYELPEPAPEVSAELLTELGQAAGVRVEDPETLARRNDGTMRNLVENLRMAANPERGLPALTPETFRDTLRGTWAERYRRAVARYPEARYLYWAAAFLRRYGFPLAPYTVLPLARALMNAPVAQDSSCATGPAGFPTRQTAPSVWDTLYKQIRQVLTGWVQYLRLPRALRYLERHEAIYSPRDGQLEAAGSPEVKEEEVVQALIRLGFRHRLAEALDNLARALMWPDPNRFFVYHPDAVLIMQRVTNWQPQKPGAWYRLGVALYAAGQKEEAMEAFQKAIALDPQYTHPWNSLGLVYATLGWYEEALAAYRRAIELDPKYAAPWYNVGNVHYALGRHEEAIEAFQRAIALNPNLPYPWNGLGRVFRALGRHEEAIEAYQRAIALGPELPYPWNGLGWVYRALGQHEEAIEAFQRAIALNPKLPYPWNGRGWVFLALGWYEEAIEAFQQAIALDPKLAQPWSGLGWVFLALGWYEEAIKAFQKAIALDPKFAYSWYGLGYVYGSLGQYEKEIEVLQRAVELVPEDGSLHASLARVLLALGQEDEAQAELERARPLMGKKDEYARACFAAICGEAEEALRLLEIALQKWPGLRLCARQDPDLRSLHSDPRFWQIVAQNESCGKSAFNRGRNVERLSDPYIQG